MQLLGRGQQQTTLGLEHVVAASAGGAEAKLPVPSMLSHIDHNGTVGKPSAPDSIAYLPTPRLATKPTQPSLGLKEAPFYCVLSGHMTQSFDGVVSGVSHADPTPPPAELRRLPNPVCRRRAEADLMRSPSPPLLCPCDVGAMGVATGVDPSSCLPIVPVGVAPLPTLGGPSTEGSVGAMPMPMPMQMPMQMHVQDGAPITAALTMPSGDGVVSR